jgi:hypothetical protein
MAAGTMTAARRAADCRLSEDVLPFLVVMPGLIALFRRRHPREAARGTSAIVLDASANRSSTTT